MMRVASRPIAPITIRITPMLLMSNPWLFCTSTANANTAPAAMRTRLTPMPMTHAPSGLGGCGSVTRAPRVEYAASVPDLQVVDLRGAGKWCLRHILVLRADRTEGLRERHHERLVERTG